MATQQFQPRFVAYAKAHGREPQAQLDHDSKRWPGGCMCGFICWIGERKAAFLKVWPDAFYGWDKISDQAAWTAFLES